MVFYFLLFVDFATLLSDPRLLVININVNNVIFMELFGPSVGNSVFHFVFQYFSVWTFGERLIDTRFVQLVKFIIEFCDHVLDVLSFFFLIQFIYHSLLYVTFSNSYALHGILP